MTPDQKAPIAPVDAREAVARIVDPDAWHESLPTDGCGVYWIGRRNDARTKADAILALSPITPASYADVRQVLAHRLYDHMRPEHPLPYHACEKAVDFVLSHKDVRP